MAQTALKLQHSKENPKTPIKNNNALFIGDQKSKSKQKAMIEDNKKKVLKAIPKLNLEALKKNHIEEVKFFTPREQKKMT